MEVYCEASPDITTCQLLRRLMTVASGLPKKKNKRMPRPVKDCVRDLELALLGMDALLPGSISADSSPLIGFETVKFGAVLPIWVSSKLTGGGRTSAGAEFIAHASAPSPAVSGDRD